MGPHFRIKRVVIPKFEWMSKIRKPLFTSDVCCIFSPNVVGSDLTGRRSISS